MFRQGAGQLSKVSRVLAKIAHPESRLALRLHTSCALVSDEANSNIVRETENLRSVDEVNLDPRVGLLERFHRPERLGVGPPLDDRRHLRYLMREDQGAKQWIA